MSVYKDILDDMVWSFSRLKSYEYCPYSWYLNYIEKLDGYSSFYAENGKLMHRVLEGITNGTLSIYDAPSFYLEEFENIPHTVRQNIIDNTYDKCMDYLMTIDDSVLDGYHVVGSEIKVNYHVGIYNFVGYIDLLLRDEEDNLIIVDHKSTDSFLKKNGEPRANTKELYEGYKKQLYLYSLAVKQKFGKFPTKLVFNHFKDGGKLTVVDWNMKELLETINWAIGVIKRIYEDETFEAIPKTGYCWRLCGYRRDCEYLIEDDEI